MLVVFLQHVLVAIASTALDNNPRHCTSRADFQKDGDQPDKSTKFFPACPWVLSFDFLIGPNRVVHSDNFYGNFIF